MKKADLKGIMNLAWGIVRRNGLSISEALKLAWRNFKLKVKMQTGIVKFYFQKVDGSIREAYGTLSGDIVPATKSGNGRKPVPTIQTYFDTEKAEWRCFKIANLISIA